MINDYNAINDTATAAVAPRKPWVEPQIEVIDLAEAESGPFPTPGEIYS